MKLPPKKAVFVAFVASIILQAPLRSQSIDYGMIAGFVQSADGTDLVGGGFQLLGVTPSSGFNPVGASLSDLLNTANMLSVSNSISAIDIANPGQFYQPGLLTFWSNGDTIANGTQLYILASTSDTFSLTAPWALVTGSDSSWLSPNPTDPLGMSIIEMSLVGNSIIAAGSSGPGTGAYFGTPGNTTSTGDQSLILVPGPPPSEIPVITSATATGQVGSSFEYQIEANNSPTSFGATDLPDGLTINTETGVLSGTPTALGVFVVTITASNGAGSAEQDLTLEITTGTFDIKVAGADVTVQRYGTGPKAVIFFGYTPFEMEENLKRDYGAELATLVGGEYSMFLWTYPEEEDPYSGVAGLLEEFFTWVFSDDLNDFTFDPLNFAGQATSVVEEILTATGLDREEATLVGNSFGAGVLLEDFDALTAETEKPRFVLISPSELFLPEQPPNQLPLPRTILIADTEHDGYLVSKEAIDYIAQRTSGPLPPDYNPADEDSNPHFIIGEEPTSLAYVFGLIDLLDRPTAITSARTATGQVGRDFRYTITANNVADLRTSFRVIGTLPAGLRLNSTGVISGKPTAAGTFKPQIQAINAAGTATATLTLSIAAAPRPKLSVTPTTLKGFTAKRGKASKSQRFTVSGSNLTSTVTVRAPAGYQISRSSIRRYASSLKISPSKSGALTRTTIYVRLAANKKAKVGNRNGKVTISSTGASVRRVSLRGKITR